MKTIPQARPLLGDEEREVLKHVIDQGWLAGGPDIARFESALAHQINRPETVATSSGFGALFLLLKALDISAGDEIILPAAATCSAVTNAIRGVGATPVYADTGEQTPNLNRETVAACVNTRTRAIVSIHHLGCVEDPEPLREFGVPVIEDCAQALGASIDQGVAGSLADFSFFSFYATKLITTIDGGAVSGSDTAVLNRVRDLRSYDGKTDARPRYNFKMQNLHAALGCVQLSKLNRFIETRRKNALILTQVMQEAGWPKSQILVSMAGTAAFRTGLFVAGEKRAALLESLKQSGVPARVEFMLVEDADGPLPHASRFADELLTLPTYPALARGDMEQMQQGLQHTLARFRG